MELEILSPIDPMETTTNHHHRIQCKLCPNIFVATPKSKKQNFGKHGYPGCPKCTNAARYKADKERIETTLKEMGYELLEPYTDNKTEMLLCNTNCCSRPFRARTNNILMGSTICRPCNDEAKRKRFQDFNIERHKESLKYLKGLEQFRKKVRVLSEGIYREYKAIINPDNLPRGRHENYHLDHIKSIHYCYHNDIPAEECAHQSNLQMLPWAENISKHA